MNSVKNPRKLIFMIAAVLLSVGGLTFFSACNSYVYRRSPRRVVRTYYRPNGCWVRRVTYPCWSPRGNLKIQRVRCPDGRRWKRRWIHPDRRCSKTIEYVP